MKKFIYTICAFATVLAIGCSKEQEEPSQKEYKLVVNMDKASIGDSTRASRNSWLKGDEVMLFFGSDCTKWMTIKYDGSGWSIIGDQAEYIAELAQRDDKSLTAIYCLHNEGELSSEEYGGSIFLANYNIKANAYCGTLFMTCEDGSYSVEDDLFTINATLSLPDTSTSAGQFVQFTITNISNDENVDWFLSTDYVTFRPCCGVEVSCDSDNKLSIDFYLDKNMPLQGYNSEDGVTFFGVLYAAAVGNPVNYNFTIVCISDEGEAKAFSKTFENKVLNRGSAVKFSGPLEPEQCEIGATTNGWERIM